MRALSVLRSVIRGLSRVLAIVAAAMILIMMVVMTLEVVSRATGNGSLPWSYGLVQLLLVAAVFAAAGYGEQIGEHIRVDLFTARMAPRVAAVLRSIGNLVAVVVIGIMCYATAGRAIESISVGEFQDGLVAFPVWPSRVMLSIGLLALFLELVFKLIDTVTAIRGAGSHEGSDTVPAKEAI